MESNHCSRGLKKTACKRRSLIFYDSLITRPMSSPVYIVILNLSIIILLLTVCVSISAFLILILFFRPVRSPAFLRMSRTFNQNPLQFFFSFLIRIIITLWTGQSFFKWKQLRKLGSAIERNLLIKTTKLRRAVSEYYSIVKWTTFQTMKDIIDIYYT